MVSFSEGLLLFVAVLVPVYLSILVFSTSNRIQSTLLPNGVGSKLAITAALLTILNLLLLQLPGFKTTPSFLALILFTVIILLCSLRTKGDSRLFRGMIVLSTLLLHIIIIYTPPYGVRLGERSPALARMAIEGFYDTARPLLSPVYNPFPMDRGLLLIFTEVTDFYPIARFSEWLISLSILLTIDLSLFSLSNRLTNSLISGVLAIFIFAITPPVTITTHISKHTSLMLVLVSTFTLILAFKKIGLRGGVLIWVLAYTAAILYHPTAGLMLFVLSSILAAGFLMERFLHGGEWEEIFKGKIFRIALVASLIITLFRWIYGGGFEAPILPSIRNFLLQMLQWDTESGLPAPLYERSGINPLQAYAWATPVAMAAALILYYIIRKRSYGVLIPSIAIGGGAFLLIGMLGGYLRAGGFAASMYPGFAFLMPSAASVAWRALHSHRVSFVVVLIGLLTASAIVAVQDPMLSPAGFGEGVGGVHHGNIEHFLIASTTLHMNTPENALKAPYEIIHSVRYLDPYVTAEGWKGEVNDPKYNEDYLLLIEGSVKTNTLYVVRREQIPTPLLDSHINGTRINLIYSTQRYVGFEKYGHQE